MALSRKHAAALAATIAAVFSFQQMSRARNREKPKLIWQAKLIFIAHRDRVLPKPTKAVELATLGNSEMTRDSLASEEVCRNFFGR